MRLKEIFASIRKNRALWITIAIIMLLGLALRVICCFWGYPHHLHRMHDDEF